MCCCCSVSTTQEQDASNLSDSDKLHENTKENKHKRYYKECKHLDNVNDEQYSA